MTNALHARGPAPDGPRGDVDARCSSAARTAPTTPTAAPRSARSSPASRPYRPELDVREAFVDVQQPEVADVVAHALDGDASGAVVVPLLLSVGFHVKVDIAAAVDQPGATAAAPLGPDPRLVDILVDRLDDRGPRAPTTPSCSPPPGRPTRRPRSPWSRSPPVWPTAWSSP